MADLPHRWRQYVRLQEELMRSTKVGDRAWGLEGVLNLLLVEAAEVTEVAAERAVASAGRRERHRNAILKYRLAPHTEGGAFLPDQVVDAERALQGIRSSVSDREWFALISIAEGHSYLEVAQPLGTSAGALRTHVFRVRKALAAAAA